MKLIITLLFFLTLITSQRITCNVCFNVAKCPQALFYDNYVDPLYKSLPKYVQESNYPQEITREVNQRTAIYTFIWPTQNYRAEVDLATKKFIITVQSKVKGLRNTEDQLGLRPQTVKTEVSTSETTSEILSQIDLGIKTKYFSGQTVTCIDIRSTPRGYVFIYKKSDGSTYSFDVTVENKNGNILVNFKPVKKEQTQTLNPVLDQISVANQFPTIHISTSTQQSPTTGGYEIITSPLKDIGVKSVVLYLMQKFDVLKFATLNKVQKQIVAGTNYRLTLKFDSSSPAYYIVVVNRNLQQKYSILSIKLTNVPSSYKFTTPLTAKEVSQLSYLATLSNGLAQQLPTLLISGSILDQIYVNFPFYQLVFHNSAYSRVVVVVSYDIMANKLKIISKNAVSIVKPQPTCKNQQSVQCHPPVLGGFKTIDQPLSDRQVQRVITFLNQKLNNGLNFATLLKVQQQIVSGTNYRLYLSFDTSSKAYYIVVVYKDIQQKYSITSITLKEAPTSYKFTIPLTAAQVSQLSYLTNLSNSIAQQLPTLLISGSILDQIYVSFPFYQFVYRNNAYTKIIVVVSFDILANKLTIISKNAVPAEAPKPQVPQTEAPKPTNSNHLQSQVQINQGLQKLSQQVLISEPIQNYIILQSNKDACYSLDNLVGVYWNDKEKTTLCFRYKSAQDVIVTVEYIQFVFRQATTTAKPIQIDNCLQQKGQVCTLCAFKYYLNGGKCFQVAPECRDFDYKQNQCKECYNGFYLDLKNVCQAANFLCQTTDRQGNCVTCYKDFTLTKTGLCVFNAQGDFHVTDQQSNPICSKFIGGKCVTCIKGAYLNTKSLCRLPDQNCQHFDQVKEVCNVCMNKYELSPSSTRCVPTTKY